VYGNDLISGGSSSGSALAVAVGEVPFTVATDTAGSGRVPPALNGILGYKPSRGLISAVGLVPEGHGAILGADLAPGDEIVLVASSGLHANGASLARQVVERLEQGYATRLPSGRAFGEALLDQSVIYVALVRALLASRIDVHYLSHITGHGLLKLMRPRRELSYRVRWLPEVPEVLAFLAEAADMAPAGAYQTFNMGCGFAVYCAAGAGEDVVRIASECDLSAGVAGVVEEGPRRVVLEPIDVVFGSDDMNLAPRG
jgi:phosphoribosylformylglycinamidine cyclo-ligase